MLVRLPILLLFATAIAAAEVPFFVDLAPAANTARLDDGIADNGLGGWSDEGINDMGVYPPIPVGAVERNAHHFRLVDPESNGGKAVVMLRGAARATDKPLSVEVAVPTVRGAYLYFLQHSVGPVAREASGYTAATYVIHYADGTSVEVDLHDGKELQTWWCSEWYHNAGADAWPIFIGHNFYSQKWKRFIGVFATRWANPHPDKAITGLTLASAGKAAPVIWAITIADQDWHADEARLKQHYQRVESPDPSVFADRLELERRAIFALATSGKLLTGVRAATALRDDLVLVTIDSAIAGIGPGNGFGLIEKVQVPGTFRLTSADDPAYAKGVQPSTVGRETIEAWKGDLGSFPANTFYHHRFHLRLGRPLRDGSTYTVTVGELAAGFVTTASFTIGTTPNPAIKVNQVGYASTAQRRYAYLGWWAGDLGPVSFADHCDFQVLSATDGREVLKGAIRFADEVDPLSGEKAGELDLSALPVGRYRIVVPGVGCSDPFAVGGTATTDLYVTTARAFFHQRAGVELLAAHTDFSRPATWVEAYESGYMVGNRAYQPKPDEPVRSFHGGYHDAGDDDVFTYHLRATAQLLSIYALHPKAFADGDLNLPESGNRVPDVLDEAEWALFSYADLQRADGAVPLGRGNDQDLIRDWDRSHQTRPPFGILPPRNTSSSEYAAVAAQFARLIKPFEAAKSDRYLTSARRALVWTLGQPLADEKNDPADALFRAWAAAEIFAATGNDADHAAFLAAYRDPAMAKLHWKITDLRVLAEWPYLASDHANRDKSLVEAFRTRLLAEAERSVADLDARPYRFGWNGRGNLGWGNGNGGGHYGYRLCLAHAQSGDQRFLDAASLNTDFQLGTNPLSRTFITGLGARPPLNPQLNAYLYRGPEGTGATVRGIPIYGLAGKPTGNTVSGWYPEAVPVLRSYRDVRGGAEVSSEFTITETVGVTAALYAYLHAIGGGR